MFLVDTVYGRIDHFKRISESLLDKKKNLVSTRDKCVDQNIALTQVMEKVLEKEKKLYAALIHSEIAFSKNK